MLAERLLAVLDYPVRTFFLLERAEHDESSEDCPRSVGGHLVKGRD